MNPPPANRSCLVAVLLFAVTAHAQSSKPATTTAPKKPTLAVLPFVALTGDAKENDLAERMRFAVSQKLSSDTNAVAANGVYDRLDNVQVDQFISALQISFAKTLPEKEDLQRILTALGTQFTIAGTVKGRTLTLALYTGGNLTKTVTTTVPPGNTSPKLTVEQALTDLTGTAFTHIRDIEADHSDPKAEARFAARPNLVPDPDFELAAKEHKTAAANWEVLLGPAHDPPLLLTANDATNLAPDRVAVIPLRSAGIPSLPAAAAGAANEYCLLMRMSKTVAENNGLACQSTWIPVEQSKKYRFTALYHSTGPTLHLFLKGFAEKPDPYGDPKHPDSTRREFYRAQVLPRGKNAGWDLVEMDFTPGALKPTDPKIQWLRVDLFIYLHPGDVCFDDITIKKLDE
jgi:TolB-like protein